MAAEKAAEVKVAVEAPAAPAKAVASAAAAEASRKTIIFAVAGYATCSSIMLIVNKVAVHLLPAPSVVLFFQLLTSALSVLAFSNLGLVQADPLEWKKVKPFALVVVAFLGALFTNVKTLQYANVETFVVFRSSTPLLIACLDYMFLGREMPNMRSWCSLVAILIGAVLYVRTDSDFQVRAYTWVFAWIIVFAFDQTYIKYVCDTVPMTSWGRVYYTNLLSVVPVTILGLLFRDDVVIREFQWTHNAVTALLASCLCGIGMSYSAFVLRSLVSATSFTVVGIMCKVATIVINYLIWDKHASPAGLVALSICLVGGTFYQQSPMRAKA